MLLTLTVEQRVLLHLWDTPLGDNPWEGRPELTQAGVSEAVGIARKHLPPRLLGFGQGSPRRGVDKIEVNYSLHMTL